MHATLARAVLRGGAPRAARPRLAQLLAGCRHLIFSEVKGWPWRAFVAQDHAKPAAREISLRRPLAAAWQDAGRVDARGRYSLFGQLWRALVWREGAAEGESGRLRLREDRSGFKLRTGDRLFNCVFMGEMGHDVGGLYRESLSAVCAELMASPPVLPLLAPVPNAAAGSGPGQEDFVPRRDARDAYALHMLEFLGNLMGVAMRTAQYLDLSLPRLVWRFLCGEAPRPEDLEGVDAAAYHRLRRLRQLAEAAAGDDAARREAEVLLEAQTWHVMGACGAWIPLRGGAAAEDAVAVEECGAFAEAATGALLRQFDVQLCAVRRGLESVVERAALMLFTPEELELKVCGQADVDLALLRSETEYSGCRETDPQCVFFWRVLEGFDRRDRAAFLRFVWGRSRLPLRRDDFQQPFKIQGFSRSPADSYLPTAHTCFFSIELPRYSSQEILEAKLRLAIHADHAFDLDETHAGRDAAGRDGWHVVDFN